MANSSAVVITGSGGFLGSHMAESYLAEGVRVYGVDNLSSTSPRNTQYLQKKYPKLFESFHADVCEPWTWAKSIKEKISHVYHMASPASPPIYQELALETLWVNAIGLRNALEYADKVGARVVFSSTSEVYGDPNVHPQTEEYRGNVNSFGPRACYDESKRFGEALIYTHNWKKKTKHGLVRIFNTYGPRMNPHDGRVVINFLVQALQGQNLTVYGDGQQTRSFCYVDDLIRGIRKYAASSLTEPVNIGNNTEFTVLQLAEIVCKELMPEKKLKIAFKDLPKDDPMQRCPDLTKAKKHLSWEPKIPLREGLKKMVDWLKEEPLERKK